MTVSNLAASTNGWSVYVYDQEVITSTRGAAYVISGSGITTATNDITELTTAGFSGTFTQASNSSGNYGVFTIGNVNGFTISATPVSASDGNLRAPINGIQIVPQ